MPCAIDGDQSIPIAEYGRSNVGRMKTVYRRGLGLRYGRVMQAISGVHFNYSFPEHFWPVLADLVKKPDTGPDFRSDAYFALLRNYRRHGWIILYLFGNSPAICPSFLQGRKVDWLQEFVPGSLFAPHATSLRMSDLGYRNKSQAGLSVSVNSLEHYVRDLTRAITTAHPDYVKLGVKLDGEYQQLNANLLQIENEYYSFIRPKRVTMSGERPTKALTRGGVQYVEMRSLDVSPFDPVGVNQNKLRFLEAFAAFCVLSTSAPIQAAEQAEFDGNHGRVAREGRKAGLTLRRDGRDVSLRDWALEIVDSMRGVEGARRVAHAVGALAARDAHQRGVVLQLRAAHVETAQVVLPRPLLAERVAPGRICGRGRGVAHRAGARREVRYAELRRLSRALLRSLKRFHLESCRRTHLLASPIRCGSFASPGATGGAGSCSKHAPARGRHQGI